MVKPSRGSLSGRTRSMRSKRKVSIAQRVKGFKIGNKVVLVPKKNCRGEILRFTGRHGKIIESRGTSYVIEVRDGGKKKHVVVNPIHLELAA